MGWKDIVGDWILPAAGAYLGYDYGGAMGAGIGAGAGRFGGGLLQKEDTERNLKNTLAAGLLGYGSGVARDWYGNVDQKSAWDNKFNSLMTGDAAAPNVPGGGGGGLFSGGGWKMPAAMMGANVLSQVYGAGAAKKNAADIYAQQMSGWNQNAFPNSASVNAATEGATAGINQQSMLARQRLFEQLAARGMGASSGVVAGTVAEEERARRKRLSELANQMIQFQNTPRYAPPTYQGTPSAGERIADNTSAFANIAAAYGLTQAVKGTDYQDLYYKKMLGI